VYSLKCLKKTPKIRNEFFEKEVIDLTMDTSSDENENESENIIPANTSVSHFFSIINEFGFISMFFCKNKSKK